MLKRMILTGGVAASLLTFALHAQPATEAPKVAPPQLSLDF